MIVRVFFLPQYIQLTGRKISIQSINNYCGSAGLLYSKSNTQHTVKYSYTVNVFIKYNISQTFFGNFIIIRK